MHLKDFFLFCSGANDSILKRTPTEINKYTGIGATIFFTGVFASIAAGYALYTVFNSYIIAVLFAIVWGLMIFNLDRYIVSTIKKKGNFFLDVWTTLPRIGLAILIAIVISKPLELKIFETEINAELISMEQERYKEHEDLLKNRYAQDILILKSDIKEVKLDYDAKKKQVSDLQAAALAEADGTGGSMKRNLGPIYKAKKAEADKAEADFENGQQIILDELAAKQSMLVELEEKQKEDLASLDQSKLTGFASRLSALDRLSQKNRMIYMASIFIMLLFIAIETAPIFVKLITSRSPYDYVLDKHEYKFQKNNELINTLLKNEVESQLSFDQKTRSFKTEILVNAEKEISKAAIEEQLDHIKKKSNLWKTLLKKGSIFSVRT